MKNQNPLVRRLRILLLFFGLFLLTAVVTLSDAQIVHGNENRAKSISSNAQTETVEASRGIITDRNGKVLVGNKLAYSLEFSSKDFTSDDELNTAILRLVNLMQSSAVSWNDTLPVQMAAPFDLTGYDNVTGLESLLKKHKIAYTKGDSLTIGVTGAQLLSVLRNDYGVDSSLSDSDARLIVGVRYGLELSRIQDVKYTFASDVSVELISQVVDGEFKGVTAGTSSVRVYNTTHAAHILGYIGSIWSEEWNSNEETGYVGYKDKGYSMNALVGKAGGTASAVGTSLAISAVLELPAMTLVSRLQKRFSPGFFLRFAAGAEVVKFLIFYLAHSMPLIYLGHCMQFFQFAVYAPATVYYVAAALPERDQLKGQLLIYVAGSGLGGALGNLLGGRLLDRSGIQAALLLGTVSAAASLLTFCLSTREDSR